MNVKINACSKRYPLFAVNHDFMRNVVIFNFNYEKIVNLRSLICFDIKVEMEVHMQDVTPKIKLYDDILKKPQEMHDPQMTSSTVSSLSSPVDSGVQLLDSESELTSVMSVSGFGCDVDTLIFLEHDISHKSIATNNDDNKTMNGEDIKKEDRIDIIDDEKSDLLHKKPQVNELYSVASEKDDGMKVECMLGYGKGEDNKINSQKNETLDFSTKNLNLDDSQSNYERDTSETEEEKHDSEKIPDNSTVEEVFKAVLTENDFVNRNIFVEYKNLSSSVPNYFDKFDIDFERDHSSHRLHLESKSYSDEVFEMEHPIQNADMDLMNVSLTSYELLDYTLQNKNVPVENENVDMHVSLSEEVNENLKLQLNNMELLEPGKISETIPIIENKEKQEEQIVFRRQRKKKTKSDTPKKRVSFHEDILNSTKIDDIHINHGFITHESDVSLSFFQRGFVKKPDVVKGRYSWAAEGDAPFYEKNTSEREIKSDIYVNQQRYSSTSSSSTASISSSIDEEDTDETYVKKEPSLKSKPKSSCLKKTKHHKRYIDTNIVQEETTLKKKSETNLLDTNIFGSLKNILNFSTSVPLAERGVPEGQEDITVFASSYDLSNRRKSFGHLQLKNFETIEVQPEPISKMNQAKTNLKLTKSEGFYPSYPNVQQNLPANIILCDSNVYEHKGISYSYEYDKFQKTFEQQNKPKSSTVYQMILKEFNFFRRKARSDQETDGQEEFEIINQASTPLKSEEEKIEQVEEPDPKDNKSYTKSNSSRLSTISKLDWSDNETVSSDYELQNSRHISSPKRKVSKTNHYSISQSYKVPLSDTGEVSDIARSLPSLRPANSKSSLINRFLRNVTLKKMMDMKSQNKQKNSRRIMSLYVKGVKVANSSDDVDKQLDDEVNKGRDKLARNQINLDKKMIIQFRKELLRNRLEKVLRVFDVKSAYTTNGDARALLVVLTDSTLYIASLRPNGTYCNHFVLPFTELNTVLIGPNCQTIHFSNYDKDMQCIVSTGCSNVTSDLVGQLEMAMRRDVNRPKLLAVKQLNMRDMVNLRSAICRQTSVDKDEEYYYYSIVNMQDLTSELESTPLGPNKEGPLMFKTSESESSRWETAYFILKAGVLYMLSSASQRVPMRVFPLINGSCQGARRIFNSLRPHTFQLIVENKSLLLAAPDEYVASEWLQELVHAASGTYNHREKSSTQSCSLLLTSDHILTVREAFPCTINTLLPSRSQHEPIKGTQVLSCASIVDLTSFRLPSAEQSWCILEFACREVHEYSGDWILYFSTNAELENFISTLENLWQYNNENGDSFPLSTIPETDPLSKKCVDVYTSLIGAWPSNTVLLQFM